ncbi:MAG TPA: dUTP diphosphatase [Caulobacteraceae bacterium]|jgi:dUTP pyrophosphatase
MRLAHGQDLPLPAYETSGAAGMDLRAAIESDLVLGVGERIAAPTGIIIALANGFEAQVRPRSGLALRQGLTCLNTPGTIDSDYRGEIKVILINLGGEPVTVRRGDRIAQLVIAPVIQAEWVVVEAIEETTRGPGGFGSTGSA